MTKKKPKALPPGPDQEELRLQASKEADDPDWGVGYPRRINGCTVTVYLLESGWEWSHGYGGSTGFDTEREAKLSAAEGCLGVGGEVDEDAPF